MRPQAKPRLLIIGIDGADYLLSQRLFAEGLLPNLQSLAQRGSWGPIRSTVPPTTPPAWTTIMTGKNPGKHGVYDFLPMSGEAMETPIASRRRATTLWRALSDAGLRVGTFNLPATYPPEPLSGFQVAGFDAPAFQTSLALPEQAFTVLHQAVGEYDLCPFSIQDPEGDLDALEQHADLPVLGTRALLNVFPCDVYMVSFQIVDWMHHGKLGHEMSAGDPASLDLDGACSHTYQLVDDRVGALLDEWASDESTVVVISDHGGTAADRLVNLEKVFLEHRLMAYASRSTGQTRRLTTQRSRAARALRFWMSLKSGVPWLARLVGPLARRLRGRFSAYQEDVTIDWSRTRAAPWGEYAQVRMNMEGRDPRGIVKQSEAQGVAEEVADLLSSLTDPVTGKPIYREVLRNEQLYSGPYAGLGPDLYAVPTEERYLTVSARSGMGVLPLIDVQREPVVALAPSWGVHSSVGIVLLAGPLVQQGAEVTDATLADFAPTALYLLDQPIPDDMDGRPLLDAITPEVVSSRPVRTCDPWAPPETAVAPQTYSKEEQARVERRLRQLGYM